MKKSIIITNLLFLIITLSFTGCSDSNNSLPTEEIESLNPSNEVFQSTDITDGTTNPLDSNYDFSPLALLGDYYVTETGYAFFKYPYENREFDVETFRKYFFGTWNYNGKGDKNDIIIDDSQKSNVYGLLQGDIIWVNDHVIAVSFTNGGMGDVWWLDINEPDKLYHINEITGGSSVLSYYELENEDITDDFSASIVYQNGNYYDYYIKTDISINEPENGFLSRLKLCEIMYKYGIEHDMLFQIRYTTEDGQEFIKDDYYFSTDVYLISEEADKLVFKSSLIPDPNSTQQVNVTYTIEKINDEWTRVVEIENEN